MKIRLCALVLALLLLAGCGASAGVELVNPINFYFCVETDGAENADFERPSARSPSRRSTSGGRISRSARS